MQRNKNELYEITPWQRAQYTYRNDFGTLARLHMMIRDLNRRYQANIDPKYLEDYVDIMRFYIKAKFELAQHTYKAKNPKRQKKVEL